MPHKAKRKRNRSFSLFIDLFKTLSSLFSSFPLVCSSWLSQLESTRWLHNLSALISVASFVVGAVDKQAQPVLVHCSGGWDRTPQITALAEVMLDPYYRTIDGFQVLVQREWIAYGHKFADRCGHGVGTNDPNERSPLFLQWLDCIYQLLFQNPHSFRIQWDVSRKKRKPQSSIIITFLGSSWKWPIIPTRVCTEHSSAITMLNASRWSWRREPSVSGASCIGNLKISSIISMMIRKNT